MHACSHASVDVHITADDVIIMFHDASLGRTTTGSGRISQQNYYGGIEHVRTAHKPPQKIPTFQELCEFLMKPEYRHVRANVRAIDIPSPTLHFRARPRLTGNFFFESFSGIQIDIKPDNDPDRLFRLMKGVVSQHHGFETLLAPRLILGLWHPKFLGPALEHVPTLRRTHIGGSPALAKQYFWDTCEGFSMYFASLVPADGQDFLKEALAAGKEVMVWTVNRPDEMVEAARWGVTAILTDRTDLLKQLRSEMAQDFTGTYSRYVRPTFRWATWRYYALPLHVIFSLWRVNLEFRAGESFAESHQRRVAAGLTDPSATPVPSSEGSTVVGTPSLKAIDAASLPIPSVPTVPNAMVV